MAIGYSWPVERVDISKSLEVYPNEDLLLQPASYRSAFRKEQLLELREISEKRKIRSVHIKYYTQFDGKVWSAEGWRDASDVTGEELTRELQQIEEILPEVELVVTHPPMVIFADLYRDNFRKYISILSRAVNNTDNIRIAIENMRNPISMYNTERVRYARDLLDKSGEPRIGFAIDTSHLHLRGRKKMSRKEANTKTFHEYYEEAGGAGRVFQLHVSDPKHSALSDKRFDWPSIFEKAGSGIDKIIEVKTPEELKGSVEYLKEHSIL